MARPRGWHRRPYLVDGRRQGARAAQGACRFAASLVGVPGLPVLAVLVDGFDWVSLVAGVTAGSVLLAVVHRRVAGPVAFGLPLLVPSFAALESMTLGRFHTLGLDGPPPRLHWCGRDYLLGSRSWPAPPRPPGSQDERVVLVTPSGVTVFSAFGCTPQRVPTLLFTPVGRSTWFAYGLQGGP